MISQHVTLTDLLHDPENSGLHSGSKVACNWNGESYYGKIVCAGGSVFIESDDTSLPSFSSLTPHKFIKEVVKHVDPNGKGAAGRSWQCLYLIEGEPVGEIPHGSKTLLQVKREYAQNIARSATVKSPVAQFRFSIFYFPMI